MTLKEQINQDFVAAYKEKNDLKKNSLGFLKSKITEEEKKNKNIPLDDKGVLKVILTSVKQRKQSIADFEKANRTDLVEKETIELYAIEAYLPSQLSREEIQCNVNEIITGFTGKKREQVIGMTIGAMNKKFPGQFDSALLLDILNEIPG